MQMTPQPIKENPVRAAIAACRPHFAAAAAFSAVSNILALVPSLYMMQVYDRVVPTRGVATLVVLSIVALFGLIVLSLLEWLRGRLLVRAGAALDGALAGRTLTLILSTPRLDALDRVEAMRNLDTLRQGISSPAATAIFDIPWAPVYILVAFLLHWALGLLTLVSAIVLLLLAWDNERGIRRPARIAGEAAGAAYARQNQISAHAGEVRALGMTGALAARQLAARHAVNRLLVDTSFTGGNHSGLIRFLRLTLQSAALGLGAYLVTQGRVSGGAIFAASLLLGRALAPIELVVAAWKSLLQTRAAHDALTRLFGAELLTTHTLLPPPTGALQVERLTMLCAGSDRVALADISFAAAAGEAIAVVGQSGSGKSTLLRALAGADTPARGHVRLDGASIEDWDPERLAPHIGYLPQNFVLFPGTVKENIARFRGGADPDAIDEAAVAAAVAVGAHEMILRLPHGYDTPIGQGGIGLSSGQAQRVAIARALFGAPRLILLDEPTSHLDGEAQQRIAGTLLHLRTRGVTLLFATHSAEIVQIADKVLLLREGRLDRFVPRSEAVTPMRQAQVSASQKAAS